MLFNSYPFLFFFLPATFLGYFWFNRHHLALASRSWLVFCSLFFYSWWNVSYLPLILASILVNYTIGAVLGNGGENRKSVLACGVLFNVLLLVYFKYFNFFIDNLNMVTGLDVHVEHIVLPLAISFFTFQQIAYLVDSYGGKTREYGFLNYTLFVTFFPQLIAGPIVHHGEMMPQFNRLRSLVIDRRNILAGLELFTLGLAKKVLLADTFAVWANAGFSAPADMGFGQAWVASLSYTLQLYFDFSGYMDMATGVALLFNIKLPMNFDSPYKSVSLQDFWRRWHITLGRFLRDYVYFPLGGGRGAATSMLRNLFITFLVGGIWHGAGWTFVAWGAAHGVGIVIHRVWRMAGIHLPSLAARGLTFLFVHLAWVLFRAENMGDSLVMLRAMFAGGVDIQGVTVLPVAAVALGLAMVWGLPNSRAIMSRRASSSTLATMFIAVLACLSLIVLEIRNATEFLYFQF